MGVDWVARWIAIGSSLIAIASLMWNIIAWQRQGPVVRFKARCEGRKSDMKISGRIFNRGRFDAQIERVQILWYAQLGGSASRPVSADVPSDHIEGISLPLSLPAQKGHEFTIVNLEIIDPGLNVALHDFRDVRLIFRTASGKSVKSRVTYPDSRTFVQRVRDSF